jgi:hypothetical protein
MLETHEVDAIAAQREETATQGTEFPRLQQIPLETITLNAGTQSRKAIHEPTVDNYAQAMEEGRWQWEREPLPIVFYDGENYYPGDGHHRIAAADRAGFNTILSDVRPGTIRDAVFNSTSANQFHGLPRSNADKRNQVELLLQDDEWQKMSDRAIAEHCGVSGPFVGKLRAETAQSGTANISSERVDRRGRKLDTSKIGAKPKDPPAGAASEEMTELAEELTQAASEAMQKLNSTLASHENNGVADLKLEVEGIEPSIDHELDHATLEETAHLPQPEEQLHIQEEGAIHAVAENQIELLSQKMGAKAVALLALDFCSF